ncbi:protein STABILIZED1-like [Prunus yedoensis var. nudiflora]|uniref:Protein STABILIZED1-like n=1 Tax=Prunus yedoensis var. nudiflora TaxID=2094558 RepID=A0A314Y109_PRUYE|nr:protein STABILIZED1-like [Prunus yedoensis var. nudiflora]
MRIFSFSTERGLGNVEEERKLLDEGLKKFPSFFKLWLMLGQLEERLDRLEKAKEAYDLGLKHCPNSIPLWLSLVNLEENLNGVTSARAVLTLARNKNPQNPQLWLAATRTELRHGNNKEADILMAKALHECPNSGILWAAYIESMVPLPLLDGWTRLLMPSGNVITIAMPLLLWPSFSRITVRLRKLGLGSTRPSQLPQILGIFGLHTSNLNFSMGLMRTRRMF